MPQRPQNELAAAILAALVVLCGCPARPELDLVLRGGMLVDGTGSPPRVVDVGVREDRVVAIGDLEAATAEEEIDAAGLVVAPGFVDLHSHGDLILLADEATQQRLFEARIRQGVTTIVVGNCGLGVAPAGDGAAGILAAVNGWMTPENVSAGPLTIGEYLERLEDGGVALNAATLVPHGPVRISTMGLAAGAPTDEQLASMRDTVARALDDGAFGLSSGLIYPPGMYSPTDELVALAEEVAARDRLMTAHVRGSSETLLRATEELVEIARASGARVHHSHMEAVGDRFWSDVDRMLEIEDRARESGLSITHDVFLYTRAATMMAAIFPPWSLEGGVPALLERLADPAQRARIATEIETRVPEWPPWVDGGWPHNLVEADGWDGILIASVAPGGPEAWIGRSLEEIAAERGREPFDVVADLMLSQDGRVGQLVDEISGRGEQVEALLRIFTHPAAAVISDAEDYGRGAPHPAHAGAFARALRINRERELMPLEDLVRRMTGYPASIVGLDGRGVLREGAPADIVLFDTETVADRATWSEPREPARGIRSVWINGRGVVRDGRYVGGSAGRVLRAGG
jgi:N-acyl-D-aspartate/D-glutamate deacylase